MTTRSQPKLMVSDTMYHTMATRSQTKLMVSEIESISTTRTNVMCDKYREIMETLPPTDITKRDMYVMMRKALRKKRLDENTRLRAKLPTGHLTKQVKLGRYYGFPECCIRSFGKSHWWKRPTVESLDGTGYIPCDNCFAEIYHGRMSVHDVLIDRKCIYTFPEDGD